MSPESVSRSAAARPEPRGDHAAARALRRFERALDRVCGEDDNPMRQLGGLGYVLFWLVAGSGGLLYVFYDTSVAGAWASVERIPARLGVAGTLARGLHRYACDAFAVVIVLHLLRELVYGRFRGFRWFSWLTGVPTLWLAFASGVLGYWLVWDQLAAFVAVAVTEWFAVLPGFGPALVRNFITEAAVSDRFFSLLVFLHIGVPLVLLLAMWVHVQRITRPRTGVSWPVFAWTLAALSLLALAEPTRSMAPADLGRIASGLAVDWFYLSPFVAMYRWSGEALWAATLAATVVLAALPWLGRRRREAPAVVEPDHCNGCTRCLADCPYAAITMAPHPGGRGRIAVVANDLCAACGICAGACPSSTPFRSGERLVTGIDLPQAPVDALRARLERQLGRARAAGEAPVVVFGCERGATGLSGVRAPVVELDLVCAGVLPPSFVEFALRGGAAGVVLAPCPTNDCEFRTGAQWVFERTEGVREPRLRAAVDRRRVRVVPAAREDVAGLAKAVDAFARDLAGAAREPAVPRPETEVMR